MKKILFAAALVLLMAGASSAQFGIGPKGEVAPDFFLRDTNGKVVTLTSLRGSVVIINFWATWCPPCREEVPYLNVINTQYKARGVRVFGITADPLEENVRQFSLFTPIDYTVLMDRDGSTARKFGVHSIPTTFIIDRDGFMAGRYFYLDGATLVDIRKRLEELIR